MDETWIKTSETYDLKSLEYFYKNLENVKNSIQIKTEKHPNQNIKKSVPTLTIEKTFNVNIQDVYTYVSDLKFRHLWDTDVKRIDFDSNKINRVGTGHKCVLNLGHLKFETIKGSSSDSLIYGEKTKDMMFTKDFSYLIKLDKTNENTTQVTVNIFLDFTTIGTFIKRNILKMVLKTWNKKLEQLHQASKIKL